MTPNLAIGFVICRKGTQAQPLCGFYFIKLVMKVRKLPECQNMFLSKSSFLDVHRSINILRILESVASETPDASNRRLPYPPKEFQHVSVYH
jgi:hypothetical protein